MSKLLFKTMVAVLAIAAAAMGPARAQSNPTKYTSAVAMSALQVGDTLAGGFSLTGNDANTIYLVANRHKNNENLFGSPESINLEWIQSIGANCVFSTHPYNEDYTTTFAPVDENGRDGDAWVVTEVENIAGFTYLTIAGIRIPGPPHTVHMAEGTEDAEHWSLSSGNASVQGTQVLEGVMSGSQLTATYNGDKKVKSVKAVKYIAPWDGNLANIPAWAMESDNVTVVVPDGLTLYNTLSQNYKIVIADGATVTLNNASISYSSNGADYAGLTLLGDGTIVLADGTTNTVVGGLDGEGYSNWPGIYVPEGKTLTINGNTGVLNATRGLPANDDGSPAGIGAAWGSNCGNIVINGGVINATGGGKGAGIGGCGRRGCGDITINGGTVTAIGGSGAPGIGLGGTNSSSYTDGGTCGDITISGGTVNASGGEGGAGIGTGYSSNTKGVTVTKTCGNILINGGTVTATGGANAAGIGTGKTNDKGIINIGTITITDGVERVTATAGSGAPNSIGKGTGNNITCGTVTGGGTVYWNNTDYENDGDFYLTQHTFLYPIVWNGNLAHFVPNGMTLTDTLNADYKITIAAGDTVILDNAVILGESGQDFPWAGINCLGDATIILKDETTNSVKGFNEEYPGIHIASGGTLTLQGTGALTATSNGWAAGIGGGYNISCGNIHIKGGTITATGGNTAAAIGGGRYTCGDITISGGTITATGGSGAAAIGGGYKGLCGDITITTGVTLLTATKGNDAPNSIGAGDEGACGTVTAGDREYYNGITKSPYTYPEPIVLVTSITLNKSVSTLAVGAFEILSVTTVVPDSATDQSVSWNSSDESKATVDQNGRVTAVAAGTALIIATTNDGSDVKDTCTMTVVEPVTWDGNLSFVPNGMTLTDTLNADYKITIAAGDTVILDNAVIIGENDENYPWAGINCEGDATIILKDGSTNSVKGFYEGYPGIHIASGGTLTLQGETAGTGALTVTNNGWAAAIGGGYENLPCGNIHIKGGVITANGRGCAAAIGGGRTSDCGNITISGGTVNANGGSVAAAIGGGQLSNCGDITITTGVTRVTATMGTDATYCIGKGVGSDVTCGTITIGGTVYPDGITTYTYTYPEP